MFILFDFKSIIYTARRYRYALLALPRGTAPPLPLRYAQVRCRALRRVPGRDSTPSPLLWLCPLPLPLPPQGVRERCPFGERRGGAAATPPYGGGVGPKGRARGLPGDPLLALHRTCA
jgi:hypothetical protein